MPNLTPHTPAQRPLIWPALVLDLQDLIAELEIDVPLFIVGGAVRDAFLHRPVKDLDMATPQNAIALARRFANHLNGDIFVMDSERDVARVLITLNDETLTIDFARFRGTDLEADLLGRDFTINAMAVDWAGDLSQIIDPLGAEQDLTQKILRRCTETSIVDDPIRALRALRQSVQFSLRIEPKTKEDIRTHANQIMDTSPERVRDEFMSMLSLERVAQVLRVAYALGLLEQIVPHVKELEGLELPAPHIYNEWQHTLRTIEKLGDILTTISYRRSDNTTAIFDMGVLATQLNRYRSELNAHLNTNWPNDRAHRALLMLGALLHRIGPTDNQNLSHIASEYAKRLKLSNQEKKRLTGMIAHYQLASRLDYQSKLDLHRYWYGIGEIGVDACLLSLANYLATYGNELEQDAWLNQNERTRTMLEAYYYQHDTIVSPPMLVSGSDLVDELQLEPGPLIGNLLTRIREGQVSGTLTSREEAIAASQRFLADENESA